MDNTLPQTDPKLVAQLLRIDIMLSRQEISERAAERGRAKARARFAERQAARAALNTNS